MRSVTRRHEEAVEIVDLSYAYDLLYEIAESAMEMFNPCQIKDGKCRAGEFCCDGCKHLGRNGCRVKALACKVWLCDEAARDPDNQVCKSVLEAVGEIAKDLKINGSRCSKEESLGGDRVAIIESRERVNGHRKKLAACGYLMG